MNELSVLSISAQENMSEAIGDANPATLNMEQIISNRHFPLQHIYSRMHFKKRNKITNKPVVILI